MSEILVQRRVAPIGLPAASTMRAWALAVLGPGPGDLTIRIVDEAESQALNRRYRGKDKPTNVLSFPYDGEMLDVAILGDLVICAPVVASEATDQGKDVRAHWAHMIVHGCLHLLGYDHEIESEADAMEQLEREILGKLGFPDPYQ